MLRVCDVMAVGTDVVLNLAAGDLEDLTKTGLSDQATHAENQIMPGLKAALLGHLSRLGFTTSTVSSSKQALWTFGLPAFRDAVTSAAQRLNLPEGFCLYMARHGGVTTDILMKWRSWAEAKDRGHWQAETTLKRYVKQGLL